MYRMELALIMYLCEKHVHARFIQFKLLTFRSIAGNYSVKQ